MGSSCYASTCLPDIYSRDSTPSKYALSDAELTKLKEKAKELSRVREKMRALQDEVSACRMTKQYPSMYDWHYLEQYFVTRNDGEQAVGDGA